MKKVAIFVEGQTEQLIVKKLLVSMAGDREIAFNIRKQEKGVIKFVEMIGKNDANIYILLVNCCNDQQVKSQIIHQHDSLKRSGYSDIIGLRDLYPSQIADLPAVEMSLSKYLPTKSPFIEIIIAITEVEAWIIDELTHYSRMNNAMTPEAIQAKGIDLFTTRGHQWLCPANKLHEIYSHWGLSYKKKKREVEMILNAIDDEEIYVTVREKAPSLDSLLSAFETKIFAD